MFTRVFLQPRSQGFLPSFIYGLCGEEDPGIGRSLLIADWFKNLANYADVLKQCGELIDLNKCWRVNIVNKMSAEVEERERTCSSQEFYLIVVKFLDDNIYGSSLSHIKLKLIIKTFWLLKLFSFIARFSFSVFIFNSWQHHHQLASYPRVT